MVSPHIQAKIYVLGYPKSGNNLLCYSLSNILYKSVIVGNKILFTPNTIGDVSGWESECEEQLIDAISFEHHSAGLKLREANQINDYLIVIVRNYRECFIRNLLQGGENAKLLFKPQDVLTQVKQLRTLDSIPDCYDTNAIDYINILRCYDEWNSKTRVLVYYEDLIENFESTMESCLKGLNVDIQCSGFHDFLIHKQERLEESRKTYRFGETLSENDINHHAKKWLSIDFIKQIDAELQMSFPIFWHKYLSHYEFLDDGTQ